MFKARGEGFRCVRLRLVRTLVVEALVDAIMALRLQHPTRVGIDGRSAAGKTSLANELASMICDRGRPVLRAELDDFHRPGHKFRSMRDQWTPASYYAETYDYGAVRTLLLEPLGPDGSRRCRTRLFDSYHDRWLPEEWHVAPADAVLVADGGFLFHPELAELWDFVIWLDIDIGTVVARARRRDVAWVGSADEVERRYRQRTIPAHELYERLTNPAERAHAVVDNREIASPKIVRLLK